MAGYYVENFGCRATQADGAAIERQLNQGGLVRAATPADADVVVLNTCTVTRAADQDARSAIRRIHRTNPSARILVTGCYAQRAPQEIAALDGVSLVVGNSHKHQLAELAASNGFVALNAIGSANAVGAARILPQVTQPRWFPLPPPASPRHPYLSKTSSPTPS